MSVFGDWHQTLRILNQACCVRRYKAIYRVHAGCKILWLSYSIMHTWACSRGTTNFHLYTSERAVRAQWHRYRLYSCSSSSVHSYCTWKEGTSALWHKSCYTITWLHNIKLRYLQYIQQAVRHSWHHVQYEMPYKKRRTTRQLCSSYSWISGPKWPSWFFDHSLLAISSEATSYRLWGY